MKKKELFLLVFFVILDQWTKYTVSMKMHLYESIELIENFFHITYVQNTGAAWSVMEGQMIFFYAITLVALGVMGYVLYTSKKEQWLFRLAVVLMMSGTIGNFIDRLWLQYVRDFLDFYIFGYNFPVFNVADMALCIGVGVLFLDMLVNEGGNK